MKSGRVQSFLGDVGGDPILFALLAAPEKFCATLRFRTTCLSIGELKH